MAGILTKLRNSFRAAKRAFSGDLEPVDANSSGGSWRTVFDWRPGAWQQDDPFLSESDRTNSMSTAVLYACIRLLAWDIAKLPAKVMRLVRDVWEEAEHQVLSPLIRRPNYYQGWIDFILAWLFSYLIAGNAYILKVRNGSVVRQLIVLDPSLVQPLVDRNTGAIVYRIGQDPLTPITEDDTLVPASEIIHHRYMAFGHPLIGTSILVRAQKAAELRTGIIASNADLAAKNSVPPGILIAPEGLSDEDLEKIRKKWENREGSRIAVVDAAFKFESLQAKFIDSQSKEFAEVAAVDICVAAGVPPWKVGVGPRPVGLDIEAANIVYYQDCLQLPIEHIEQLLDHGLEVEKSVYICLDRSELFMLDSKTRATVDAILVKGIAAPNELRKRWNLPPVEGGESVYLQQQNFSLAALHARDQQGPPPSAGTGNPSTSPEPEPEEAPSEDAEEEQAADARLPVLPWSGVYDAAREYSAGATVTHKRGLWLALTNVAPGDCRPGADGSRSLWRLVAGHGKPLPGEEA